MDKAKPFDISKREVWEAFKRVKANGGSSGVDGQSIAEFDADLENNLYKLWNRMSSGSYFPSPVLRVDIPKNDGGTRPLGIPTVSDRIAQAVVKQGLEPDLEARFHPNSYGYRPGKSAVEAVGRARKQCWSYDWVLDLDIKGFFDNIDHVLLMRAVRKHTNCKWMLLYIERWLQAPVQFPDGRLENREKGTPQGGVISPLLANLFLHYAFDEWMKRNQLSIPFERFADDVICHCKSLKQARWLRNAIEQRLSECGLELHPVKTKIVYCKDDNRPGSYTDENFDFLGFTFRPRRSKNRCGEYFISFSPAVSNKALKSFRASIRGLRLSLRSDKSLDDLALKLNPIVRGWANYFGSFHRSALYGVFRHLDRLLVSWATRKFKRLKHRQRRAESWLRRIKRQDSGLFVHWTIFHGIAGR